MVVRVRTEHLAAVRAIGCTCAEVELDTTQGRLVVRHYEETCPVYVKLVRVVVARFN